MQWFKTYPEALKNVNENLKNIDIPTKIFWGEHEAILPKENGIRMHEKIRNSEFEIFENCGHFVYQDDYPRFINLVKSWVEKHS